MSCGRLNASWKISSSAVDGQSFLVLFSSFEEENDEEHQEWEPNNIPVQHYQIFSLTITGILFGTKDTSIKERKNITNSP